MGGAAGNFLGFSSVLALYGYPGSYGTELDLFTLRRIEAAEEALKELGFGVVRVTRWHKDVVRLEIPVEQLSQAVEQAVLIKNIMKALDFRYITLDLEGFRSGSMGSLKQKIESAVTVD